MKYFIIISLISITFIGSGVVWTRDFAKNIKTNNVSYDFLSDWKKLKTEPFPGKQDDIFFASENIGWYGNGHGYIYKTTDGGLSWKINNHQEGSFFRALGFVDEELGFAGNIGPDYFPGVTDPTPLYKTVNGGTSWKSITNVSPSDLKGVCSIDVLKTKFINSGVLEDKVTIRAAGRVGGPAKMVTSRDLGVTWVTEDLNSLAGMILDVKFVNESTGFLCAASSPDISTSHARILKTKDGGTTWKVVYESKRPMELIWKCSFPSSKVGYATVQSYDQDPTNTQRYVVKTIDGGDSWKELFLVDDHKVREFGIGFINEDIGWVGAIDGGYLTTDGGSSWNHEPHLGRAVNKFRIFEGTDEVSVFAIGQDVRKIKVSKNKLQIH